MPTLATRVPVLKNEMFADPVHNLLFHLLVHFNQNLYGLYYGMCCIHNEIVF